jgi:hypothetical protein
MMAGSYVQRQGHLRDLDLAESGQVYYVIYRYLGPSRLKKTSVFKKDGKVQWA